MTARPKGGAFPSNDAFTDSVREMVVGINGAIYSGDRLEAYVAVVRWMRDNPDRATIILGDFDV